MKDSLSWIAKNLVLPLVPFLIGAFIRTVHSGQLTRESFDTGELAFSMAMLSVLTMASASRLNDKPLRDSLISVLILETAFFLVMFACASLLKVQIESALSADLVQISRLSDPIAPGSVAAILNNEYVKGYSQALGRIRFFVFLVSLAVVPLTLIFKIRFKLED